MWLTNAYYFLLFTGLTVMLTQLYFRPVRIEHIFIAIFSGSLSMVALQVLTAEAGSDYQYIFALGTCATCNVIWLIARTLFHGSDSLRLSHYLVAGTIAVLVLANRSMDLMVSVEWFTQGNVQWLKRAIGQFTQLLSSTTLALTFWEAINGFKTAEKTAQLQRALFATVFFSGVFSCTVIAKGVLTEPVSQIVKPWLVVASAIAILLTTFAILIWQHKVLQQTTIADEPGTDRKTPVSALTAADEQLFARLQQLMLREKLYLQAELKTIDLANALNVSEYKVSRLVRAKTTADNINQFINQYRLAYAKQLLTAEQSSGWSILVISLECGFASLAPFNRAFKASEGCTPNQYRRQHQQAHHHANS